MDRIQSFEGQRQEDGAYRGVVASVWRWGRDGECWLSHKTPTFRSLKRRREALQQRLDWADRFRRSLYRFNGVRSTALLALLTLLVLIGAAAFTSVFHSNNHVESTADYASQLVSIAEVVGAIVGILIAVVVFAVQFHGERSGSSSGLMRFLIRWESLVPLAGVMLAFVVAQLVVSIIAVDWWPKLALGMATINLVCIPVVVGLSIYLFHRMLNSVAVDHIQQGVVPGIGYEFGRHLDFQSYWVSMDMQFRGLQPGQPDGRGPEKVSGPGKGGPEKVGPEKVSGTFL